MYPKPKKSLGQNFLTNPRVRDAIINSCSLERVDIVLEIGPGTGVLTRELAKRVKSVYAVELDTKLCELLTHALGGERAVTIINKNFLKINLAALSKKHHKKLKIIGNIPYNISTPIIEHLIAHKDFISVSFLMVQKEFGKRIVAPEGSKIFGSLSCFVQYYFNPTIMFVVSRNSFHPAPGVDSVFLRLESLHKPAVEVRDEAWFFKIIRTSFTQRRKTLKNCLRGLVSREECHAFFKRYQIREDARPEMLSLQDFANLANIKNN